MSEKIILPNHLIEFRNQLIGEEKSQLTIEKYIRDVKRFTGFANNRPITKEMAVLYKQALQDENYAIRSINSMIVSMNRFFEFMDWQECKVKTLRIQRQIYCKEDKELTKAEYLRLLKAAQGQKRLHYILQTICSTGIRISELKYFTVEKVQYGEVSVRCKNKTRVILIPGKLRKLLLDYARKRRITSGAIFITKNGKPMDRSNIWAQMKRLSKTADVCSSKVFPHNLRKLFARTFYRIEKDIAKLADILGHSSIETTRIYIMTTGQEHRRKIERLELVLFNEIEKRKTT